MKDVEVIITRETAGLTQAGFGMPLILSDEVDEEYAEYTELEQVAEDYAEETGTYKMALRIFGQNPRPPKIAIAGKDTNTPSELAAELNSIIKEHNDWYFLLCTSQDSASIEELGEWAGANKKLYFATTTDKNLEMEEERTALLYHDEDPTAAAGWVGRCAPELPGSITWKFKTINGVKPVGIGTTDFTGLHDKNINTYVSKYGISQTSEGKVTSGEYIDVIRGQDWVEAKIGEGISRLLFTSPKVPYDARGIALVVAEVESVMKQAVTNGIIAVDEDGNGLYLVSAPNIADISANDKANRYLPDVRFEFTLAGAIHTTTIRGRITV